jgi:hypothetical protein
VAPSRPAGVRRDRSVPWCSWREAPPSPCQLHRRLC